MKKYLYLAVAAALLAACSSDNGETTGQPVALRISSSIDVSELAATRATNSAWEASDKIGLYCTTNATQTAYGSASNLAYTFDDGTNYETLVGDATTYRAFTGTAVYLPADGSSIDVYAYYPYSSSATTPTAVPISVATQTSQSAIDFMRATHAARNKANNTAQLLFAHKLVKLQFNVKAGAGMTSGDITGADPLSIAIGSQPTTATYNIYTDAISIASGSSPIASVAMTTATEGYDKSFEAIVLPNDDTNNTAADRTVTLTLGTGTYTFTIGSATSFAAGNKYTYNVTVNSTGLTVVAAITPWIEQEEDVTAE